MADGKLAAALDEIRERYKTSFTTLPAEGWTHAHSADDVPRLLAALDEVLELHMQAAEPDTAFCDGCGLGYPCQTVRAISRHLPGKDAES